MIVGHEHIITAENLGKNVIPILSRIILKDLPRKVIIKILRTLNPCTHKDDLDRIANFIINLGKTQEENFKELKSYYPIGTEFNILTIDQTYMGAGELITPFEDQIQEVVNLIKYDEKIKMFLHIDCRRPQYIDLINRYGNKISGFKVYNYMGTFPYDINYEPMYHYAAKKNKPIIFHCSRGNINFYRGKDIDKRLRASHYSLFKTKNNKRDKSSNFNNPLGLIEVARKNPNVNFDIAHMGGVDEIKKFIDDNEINILFNPILETKPISEYSWTYQILKACITLPNLFTDTSFSCYTEEFQLLIKALFKHDTLCHKILYGTDFHMNKSVAYMKNYVEDFVNVVGQTIFYKMTTVNFNLFFKIKN